MADTLRPYLGKRVLELGAGIGNMTQHLSRGRRSYMATDIDEEHLARLRVRFQGRPNLSSRKVDLTSVEDFADLRGRFDTVVCLNVVEHVEDDLLALKNIFSALEPGGRPSSWCRRTSRYTARSTRCSATSAATPPTSSASAWRPPDSPWSESSSSTP